MKKHFSIVCIMLTFAMCAPLTGCDKNEKMTKVKLCEVTHSVFYAPQYAAINKGFFADENLEIELSNGQGADKVMAAVLSDQMDIGFAGPEAAIYVFNEGKADYPKVFCQLTKRDGSFLVGRNKTENFGWDDLKGKTIIPGRKGGVPRMTFEYVMKKNGINPETDAVLDDSIQFSLMAGAFSGGNADYVTLFEPTASMIELENKGYILTSIGQEAGEIPYTAYFAKQSYMEKNKDIIKKFNKAIKKGQEWVKENSAEDIALAIAPSFPDTDISILTTVVKRYKDIDVWCDSPLLKEDGFKLLQDVMKEAGELEKEAPYDKIAATEFMK